MMDGKIKVTLIDSMGSDLTVVNAARVSFGKGSTFLTDKDIKLVDYLAKNKHLSPFEHLAMTFMVECPLYIRSQIHRHRTFAYNEISRRYTDDGIEFYLPPEDDIRTQAANNKQASGDPVDQTAAAEAHRLMSEACTYSLSVFQRLIDLGVAREQARGILPQCLMTKFYMTGNLRNWAHFISLRIDAHAQKEAQYVAQGLKASMLERFPVASAALFAHGGATG